ncbi:MAG: APC family permease [Bacteroidetes bacterium]|nr:APC family permease [Bacteroidota bacterium]
MKTAVLIALNGGLVFLFVYLWKKKNLLSSFQGGRWYLSWLAVGVITLMDELTSIFYAPSEAHRFIGANAIFFIAATSVVVRLLSTRMTEIARILEKHGVRGGGVYSFSYLVLGPVMSFVAVSSIFVDYILTACISTVSAVENGHSMFSAHSPLYVDFAFQMVVIWGVCLLNIAGIKESARFTFGVFTAAAFILVTLLASGVIDMPSGGWQAMAHSATNVASTFNTTDLSALFKGVGGIVIGVSSCILAYSGIESVVQTAGLVRSWRDIHKAYLFLGLTVGIVTPVVSALVLAQPSIDFASHEGDLITFYARILNGPWFAIAVGALASFTLTMAVNTAYVASAELVERVAHRYGFHWMIVTNSRGSLHRIHLLNASLYTAVIIVTSGSQTILAEMYAVGLVASFVINMGSLLIYRYRRGTLHDTTEKEDYHKSRSGTLFLFLLLFGCFLYLAYEKPYGLAMWSMFTVICLVIGIRVARKRAPEIAQRAQSNTPMEMILYLADHDTTHFDIYFRRPTEMLSVVPGAAYVSFFSPRQGIPVSQGPGHFRLALERVPLRAAIKGIIELVRYEFPDYTVTFHFGWPLSSWFDRISTGVMVHGLMKLPREFPEYNFEIEYYRSQALPPQGPEPGNPA